MVGLMMLHRIINNQHVMQRQFSTESALTKVWGPDYEALKAGRPMSSHRSHSSILEGCQQHETALLLTLARRGEFIELASGQLLFREGERADHLYILLAGELRVFSEGRLGREVVYNIVRPVELLGEMLLDGGQRSASVRALVPSTCARISTGTFRNVMEVDPRLGGLVIDLLISRLRKATVKIRSLSLDSVYERVISLLNEHAIPSGDRLAIPGFLTQQEMANRIGSSREMVNYVIRELIKGGFLVRPRPRRLEIVRDLPIRW